MIIGISGLAGSGKDTVAGFLRDDHNFISVALADPLKRMAKDAFAFTDEQLWGPSQFRNAPDKRYPRHHNWEPAPERREMREGVLYRDNTWRNCACCGQNAQSKLAWSDERDESWKVDDSGCSPCYLTPRFALQKLGTEFGRACFPNVWVNKTMQTAKTLLTSFAIGYASSRGLFELQNHRSPPKGISIPDVRFKNEMEAIRTEGGKLVRIKRQEAGLLGALGRHPSEEEQSNIPDSYFDHVIENEDTLDALHEKVARLFSV